MENDFWYSGQYFHSLHTNHLVEIQENKTNSRIMTLTCPLEEQNQDAKVWALGDAEV